MKILRIARLMLLALLVSLVPASSYAGVFISVNFAPPILPVYDQPPCPDEGLMWTPGYWAYGEDGYFWVPGTWVPAPYEGALWTPPYWGWEGGFYIFHPGYWGRHVGYYGGVNYGFGYMGIGFVGGMWRGHNFEYNTAVMHVDERRIHNVYVDRTIVQRDTIRNDRRVAFSGGRDGIHHDPSPEERAAAHDQHIGATNFQQSHVSAAMSEKSQFAKNNGGRPSNVAVQRPLGNGAQGSPGADRSRGAGNATSAPARMQSPVGNQGGAPGQGRGNYTPSSPGNAGTRDNNVPRSNNATPNPGGYNNPRGSNGNSDMRNNNNNPHPNPGNAQPRPSPEFRQAPQQQPHLQQMPQQLPQPRQMPQQQPQMRQMPQQQPQARPMPETQPRQAPQPRPTPQAQPRPAPQAQPHPAPQQHESGGQQHGDHGDHGDHPH